MGRDGGHSFGTKGGGKLRVFSVFSYVFFFIRNVCENL